MKRRQIQLGSPFEEAQINYAIQVPNQPFPDPPNVSKNVPINPPVKELGPLQDTDFRDNFLQEIEATKKIEEIPVVQNHIVHKEKSPEKQNTSSTQQSRAQQLIQQSQQLLQRRRGNQKQNQVEKQYKQNYIIDSEPIQEQIQQPQQVLQQQQQANIQQTINNTIKQEEIQQPINNPPPVQPPIMQANTIQQIFVKENPKHREQQLKPQPKPIQQQIPQYHEVQSLSNQQQTRSNLIYSSTFYHGLSCYDQQQNQLIKIPTQSIVSQYPGPFFKNKTADNQRMIRYFWSSYKTDNVLLQLAIDHLEKQVEKNSALQIIEAKVLNDQSGQAFVHAYERINSSQDWETKLLVGLLMGESINQKQQQSLIEYIKKRTYQDDQEAWLIRLAVLLKMVPVDQEYYSEILLQLQHLYSSEQIQARLLWLLFKFEIQHTNLEIFLLNYFTKLNYSLCNSEIQILLGDSHMFFHNQQNAELYYKLSLLFIESQNYEKALECAKYTIDLGFQNKGRDLRDRILQVMELKEKNKSQSNTNNQNSGLFGYLGQAVNAVKNIQKQPQQENQVYQPQPQNFYYDKELKAYVINGVPQLAQPEEEQKKETVVAPPPPRRKIDQPKPMAVQEEQIVQQNHEIAEDPFASQSQQNQSEHNKKKNNLLRNRYVQ